MLIKDYILPIKSSVKIGNNMYYILNEILKISISLLYFVNLS